MRYGTRRIDLVKFDFALLPFLALFFLLFWLSFCFVVPLVRYDEPEDVELPFARSAVPDDNPDPCRLVLWVKKDGSVWFAGEARSEQEVFDALAVEARLSRDEAGISDRLVFIKADERVQFKHIRKLIEACRDPSVRIWRLTFGVRP